MSQEVCSFKNIFTRQKPKPAEGDKEEQTSLLIEP